MSSKVCTKCRNALTDSEFYAHCRNRDGLQSRCKVCERVANAAYQRTPEGRAKHCLWSKNYYKTPKGREARLRYKQWYQERYPERLLAERSLNRAVESGEIERQPCWVCGAEPAQGHHDDYSKPLEVRWLCPGCHPPADVARRLRERAVA